MFTESFAYPAGDLTGQGGWAADDASPNSTVVAGGYTTKPRGINDAANHQDSYLAAVNLSLPWTLSFTYRRDPTGSTDVTANVWVGDLATTFVAIATDDLNGHAGLNHMGVVIVTDAGTGVEQDNIAAPYSEDQTLSLRWTGSLFQALLNNVVVATYPGYDITTITAKRVGILFSCANPLALQAITQLTFGIN